MNANDYCYAPPPTIPPPIRPIQSPPSAVHRKERYSRRKKQPVLVGIVTSTGKRWRPVLLAEVTSTDPIGDQYWSLLPLPRGTLPQPAKKEGNRSEGKSARCDRSHSGHSPIEYRRGGELLFCAFSSRSFSRSLRRAA